MEYWILTQTDQSPHDAAKKLIAAVQKEIGNGWEPQGGVSVTQSMFRGEEIIVSMYCLAQAIVRK